MNDDFAPLPEPGDMIIAYFGEGHISNWTHPCEVRAIVDKHIIYRRYVEEWKDFELAIMTPWQWCYGSRDDTYRIVSARLVVRDARQEETR